MTELYKFCRVAFCLALIAAPVSLFSQSKRTLTAFPSVPIDQFIGGFYTSFPPGYDENTSTKYPLIVFLHGSGEVGDGSAAALPAVLRNGPPMQIDQQVNHGTNANFPDPVVVNGNSYNFLVISPQMNSQPPGSGPDPNNPPEVQMVTDIINYAIAHYRVNTAKIYLTGLSLGSGIAFDYAGQGSVFAQRLAGLLGVALGSFPASDRIKIMTAANLPVWVADNIGDTQDPPNSPIANTNGYYDGLTAAGINPPAVQTIFQAAGHGGWVQLYGAPGTPGALNPAGQNVYQWMAQYSRAGVNILVDPPGNLPVIWGSTQAVLVGVSSVRVSWTTTVEENNRYFIVQRSADGQNYTDIDTTAAANQPHSYNYTDATPLKGNNFYRIEQVDLDGKSSYSETMQVTLSGSGQLALRLTPNPSPGLIYLELSNADQGRLDVSLTDPMGRVLRRWTFNKQGQQFSQSIDPGNLPTGTYFINVNGTRTREVCTFLRSSQ